MTATDTQVGKMIRERRRGHGPDEEFWTELDGMRENKKEWVAHSTCHESINNIP